jgi:hypothetical protein
MAFSQSQQRQFFDVPSRDLEVTVSEPGWRRNFEKPLPDGGSVRLAPSDCIS